MVEKVAVILNQTSGGFPGLAGNHPEKVIADLFQEAGVTAIVRSCSASEIEAATRECLRLHPEAIVAAGGDGTINAVVNALGKANVPLGILPLGTYNHFARDLRVPLELKEAVREICSGTPEAVDVAEVNGRLFVNNSSIGAYPHAVEERDKSSAVRNKRLSGLIAGLKTLFRKPLIHVQIRLDGREIRRLTPFVFVGNNPYAASLRSGEHRDSLNSGSLCLFTVQWRGFWNFLKLIFRGLRGKLASAEEFETWSGSEVEIRTHKRTVRVATDGEVTRMPTPLRYLIHPGALRIILPQKSGA